MVVWSVDVETEGLDGEFRLGCIIDEFGKPSIYKTKEELWKRILQKGISEKKRGHLLTIYAHNHKFDFSKYSPKEYDPNIHWFTMRPFIVGYTIGEKEVIKFNDTMAIHRGSLKKLAKACGMEKIEVPEKLLKEGKLSKEELKELEEYCINDTLIVHNFIKMLKEKLENDGLRLKWIQTAGYIAIKYLTKKLSEMEIGKTITHWDGKGYKRLSNDLFWDIKKQHLHWTKFSDEIHGIYRNEKGEWKVRNPKGGGAYKGGRVFCLKQGKVENLTYVDCNSLYPYSLANMRFPNLRKEMKIENPLRNMKREEILDMVGISRAVVKNNGDDLGLLPIRTEKFNYYPTKGTIMVGTWTNLELFEAMKNGYEIVDIEWSVIWEEMDNPFKKIMENLYNLRKSGSEFDNAFYKLIMNAGCSKFAQKRTHSDLIVDSVNKVEEYEEKGYEIVGADGFYRQYEKEDNFKPANHYNPILTTLLVAYARVYMYRYFKKIPISDLIYSDTDSCIFSGDHLDKFNLGDGMGEFKIEAEGENGMFYGNKYYRVGDKVAMSGVGEIIRDDEERIKEFNEGKVTSTRMVTLKSMTTKEMLWKHVKEDSDLRELSKEFRKKVGELKNRKVFIDEDLRKNKDYLSRIFEKYNLIE